MAPDTLFKCLGDETRLLATLLVYTQGELCVCDLMSAMCESQPKISRHLAQLRRCEILDDERRGQWVYYSMNPELPAWATQVLEAARQAHSSALANAQHALAQSQRATGC